MIDSAQIIHLTGTAAGFARYLQTVLPVPTALDPRHNPCSYSAMSDAPDPLFVNLTAQLVTSFQGSLTEDLKIPAPPETTRLAGEICRMAKAQGMPPEALLIHLRTAWDEAGLTRRYPRRKDWYDHLVMHCLEEYYKPVAE